MKRWWVYIILYSAVGAFGLSPFAGTDIAKLSPVEAVWLAQTDGMISITTDGGDQGFGITITEALTNMHDTAHGTVFLDTADFLIVKSGYENLIAQVEDILRPSCCVCVANEMPDLAAAAQFLRAHEPSVKLKDLDEKPSAFPLLELQRGRLILIEHEANVGTTNFVADRSIKRTDPERCRQD